MRQGSRREGAKPMRTALQIIYMALTFAVVYPIAWVSLMWLTGGGI